MNTFEMFKSWIKDKFRISELERKHRINEGEVYWCALGVNVGDEENGKGANFRRPILVLKKFNNNIFVGVPLTTKNKDNKYYVKALLKNEIVSAMISQIRVIDTKSLDEKVGYVKREDFQNIRSKIKEML